MMYFIGSAVFGLQKSFVKLGVHRRGSIDDDIALGGRHQKSIAETDCLKNGIVDL